MEPKYFFIKLDCLLRNTVSSLCGLKTINYLFKKKIENSNTIYIDDENILDKLKINQFNESIVN